MVACGFHWISLYAFAGDDALNRNIPLLATLATFLASVQPPWVIALDANMTPEELETMHWLEQVGGTVLAPSGPTCFPGQGNPRTLDFFVASTGLPNRVAYIRQWLEAPISPRCVVELGLKECSLAMTVQVRQQWTPFPVKTPIGCENKPKTFTWSPNQSDLPVAWG